MIRAWPNAARISSIGVNTARRGSPPSDAPDGFVPGATGLPDAPQHSDRARPSQCLAPDGMDGVSAHRLDMGRLRFPARPAVFTLGSICCLVLAGAALAA